MEKLKLLPQKGIMLSRKNWGLDCTSAVLLWKSVRDRQSDVSTTSLTKLPPAAISTKCPPKGLTRVMILPLAVAPAVVPVTLRLPLESNCIPDTETVGVPLICTAGRLATATDDPAASPTLGGPVMLTDGVPEIPTELPAARLTVRWFATLTVPLTATVLPAARFTVG